MHLTNALLDEQHHQSPTNQLKGKESVKSGLNARSDESNAKDPERNEPMELASHDENFKAGVPTVPAEEYHRLSDQFNELSKKYEDLTQKVKYLQKKNAAVAQKNKDMKESVRAWQEYAERKFGKGKVKDETKNKDELSRLSAAQLQQGILPEAPSGLDLAAHSRTSPVSTDHEYSSSIPAALPDQGAAGTYDRPTSPSRGPENDDLISRTSITPKAIQQYGGTHADNQDFNAHEQNLLLQDFKARTESHTGSRLYSFPQGSSQTTEDESGEVHIPQLPNPIAMTDDEFPQFVAARSLKRKRGRPIKSEFEVYTDRSAEGTSEKPFCVKEEPLSSPPISTQHLIRVEPVDLDAPTPNGLQTPRRPRRKTSLHSNLTGTLHHQRSNSAPFTQGIKTESSVMAADLFDLDAEAVARPALAVEFRACSEPSDPTLNEPNILQELDINALVESPRGNPKKRARRSKNIQAEHNILAELGEARPPIDTDKSILPPHMARAELNRKLQASKPLQTPSRSAQKVKEEDSVTTVLKQIPAISGASPSTITPSARTGLRSRISATHSTPRDKLILDDRPIWMMNSPQIRSSTRKAHVRPTKEQKHLRQLPLAELGINDFKPNPAYNQGYSYAFTETLRKRGDRMCVPGCTNPQCCGSTFRAFAEAQASLSASQEEALLEDYLGDAYLGLTQMSPEERKELVLQARTRKMANDSGKHREAYSRRRTPPGFWRVDFPTTQEQQQDRETAKEQEKAIIHDRWLEAQRKDGKWVFRDE